jgi:O-acetyl-ADP-ribose deacetylase (regulator of RNase III)
MIPGMKRTLSNGRVIRATVGDITNVPADAIVNAANSGLRGGGGVDGAIHRAGGPLIMHELNKIRAEIGECPTGSAVATSAGSLPAKYVFHAVGPVYRDGRHGEAELLAQCYETCLRMAEERGVRTITFPAISTGVYAYPFEEAAKIAVRTVSRILGASEGSVQEVVFVLFGPSAEDAYQAAFLAE